MPTALEAFDPHHEWLGIEPREMPADHYRLLGLPQFESDPARIAAAADERMGYVRRFQTGPRGIYTARILNELSTAKLCLLSPGAKAAYDAALIAQAANARGVPAVSYAAPQPAWTGYDNGPNGPAAHAPPLAAPPIARQPRKSAPPPRAVAPSFVEESLSSEPVRSRRILWVAGGVLVALAALAGVSWTMLQQAQARRDASAAARRAEQQAAEEERMEAAEEAQQNTIVLLQEGSGEITFSPATASLFGGVEVRPTGLTDLLVNWSGAEDRAEWTFRLVRPGFFRAEMTYATPETSPGVQLELHAGEQVKKCSLPASGGEDKFATESFTIAVTTSGESVLRLQVLTPASGDPLILKAIRLIPVGGESGL